MVNQLMINELIDRLHSNWETQDTLNIFDLFFVNLF